MMCEVMPTISEDTALSQRGSQSSASDPDSHFEQLMVNMLDERDRLLDTLRETQESLGLTQQHLEDIIYDRDALQRQLSSALPQLTIPQLCLMGCHPWLQQMIGPTHPLGRLWKEDGDQRGREGISI
ncbi:hypothetical protein AAFF_G00076450 [Aldrovandia affinis]|uniref:Uncharacterized protein n=1 Tax=Aldrovandia affinis TaxID=143900 RepID=A0AAD7RXL5_9TELE|nr:hypothetical protein AAFF_G00076450 [Aldrovandia affinis]